MSMISIVTPVSHLFQRQKAGQRLEGLSDFLEYRDHSPFWISDHTPALFHSEFNLLAPVNLNRIKILHANLNKIANKVQLVSLHASCCYTKLKQVKYGYVPCGRLMSRGEMIDNAIENLNYLRKGKFKDILFAVENNNYFNTGAHEIVSDPCFLIELLKEARIKFVLDISHAMISEINGGFSFKRYLKKDFISMTVQIHVNNYGIKNEIAFDAHEIPDDNTWSVVKKIIRMAPNLKYLTVEYYKKEKTFISLLNYVKKELLREA